jgi:hypothetical protein
MSGKSVSVCGAKRGYLLTDEMAIRHVAGIVDNSPPHSGCGANPRNIAAVNRFPYTLRANAAGSQATLVLTTINGLHASVLVEKRGDKRTMTCVPLRFDEALYAMDVVVSGAIVKFPEPVFVLEDILFMGGHSENATATDRAAALYDLVHERHRADPVLEPFKLQCARHLVPNASVSRQIWKAYDYPIGSFTLCPQNLGQRDIWIRPAKTAEVSRDRTIRDAEASTGVQDVTIRASDLPDVYMVVKPENTSSAPLIVKTIEDSARVRTLSKAARGALFGVRARWDPMTRRWTYVYEP